MGLPIHPTRSPQIVTCKEPYKRFGNTVNDGSASPKQKLLHAAFFCFRKHYRVANSQQNDLLMM